MYGLVEFTPDDAYSEMTIGSRVVLNAHWAGEMGQMHVSLYPGEEGKILVGHDDNTDLQPAHRMWLVEFWRPYQMEGYTYHLWFRANKLGLIA